MILDTPWMPRLVPTANLGGAVAASTAEVTAGTDNAKFITPAALEGSSPSLENLICSGVARLGATTEKPNEDDRVYLVTPNITEDIGRGFDLKMTFSGAYGATGYNSYIYTAGATVPNHINNYQSHIFHQGTYTLGEGRGFWAYLDNSAATGAWTNGYGFYFAGYAGTIANPYAFYSEGPTPSSFGGPVTVRGGAFTMDTHNNSIFYLNRASTTYSTTVRFKTGGALKWSIGSGLTEYSEMWSLYNDALGTNALTFNPADNAAAFSGPVTIPGGLITYGANDSGGTGKRLLLVPNS